MVTTTHLIHHPYTPPEGFESPQVPTYQASTVIFPDVATMRSTNWKDKSGYTYGLHGTPTTFTLEERLASIEGATYCQLVPSGLAAIALVNLSLLKTGDEVLIPSNVYAPNSALAQGELARYGITHRVYDPMSLNDLENKISARTRLVWIESPGSVTMEFPDLIGITKLCAEKGVKSALDNTWGAGIAFNAFDMNGASVDLTIQALTKYASGGGDVLMGCVCTRDRELDLQLKLTHMRLGLGVGAADVQSVLRSLPTMALRYKAQDMTARYLAKALTAVPQIAQVLHPCLPSSPGHDNWLSCCVDSSSKRFDEKKTSEELENPSQSTVGRAASIFSVIFKAEYSQAQVDKFCDGLKYFKIGYSWGGPMSLVVPYDLKTIRPVASDHAPLAKGQLVRLCIGLEEGKDLWDDLLRSLNSAFPKKSAT